MPSKRQYNLVSDDGCDTQIPLHNDDAFQHGLHFQAKFVGSMDVPRPTSRVDIVAAMRRIRYEFKSKGIKKMKVDLVVCVKGIRVLLSKKHNRRKDAAYNEDELLVMHHPIYRIFYVSHDSQDLKIFSFIARDASTNIFRCNVFKAYKKNIAMRIVRTVGQAFEVCHKISVQVTAHDGGNEKSDDSIARLKKCLDMDVPPVVEKVTEETPAGMSPTTHEDVQSGVVYEGDGEDTRLRESTSPEVAPPACSSPKRHVAAVSGGGDVLPLTTLHQTRLLRQQLEQQQQQTELAAGQVQLLNTQLSAEAAARIDVQSRSQQLLQQNCELLKHISLLVAHVQQLELKLLPPGGAAPSGAPRQHAGSTPPAGHPSHTCPLTSSHPPHPCPLTSGHPPCPLTSVARRPAMPLDLAQLVFENHRDVKTADGEAAGSPDSGHQEMSPLDRLAAPPELPLSRRQSHGLSHGLSHSTSEPAPRLLLHIYEENDGSGAPLAHSNTSGSLKTAAGNWPPATVNRPPAAVNRPPAAVNRPPAAVNRPTHRSANNRAVERHRPEWSRAESESSRAESDSASCQRSVEVDSDGTLVCSSRRSAGQWADGQQSANQRGDDRQSANQRRDDRQSANQWGDGEQSANQWRNATENCDTDKRPSVPVVVEGDRNDDITLPLTVSQKRLTPSSDDDSTSHSEDSGVVHSRLDSMTSDEFAALNS